MADERLLAPIRRFWSTEDVTTAYQAIFNAYHSRLQEVTVFVSKGTESDNATAQVVVSNTDYLTWMDALETRLAEIENEAAGVTAELATTSHTDFSRRILTT